MKECQCGNKDIQKTVDPDKYEGHNVFMTFTCTVCGCFATAIKSFGRGAKGLAKKITYLKKKNQW